MSTKIVKFPLDKETGYPGLIPMGWSDDPRKLYAAARWLKELLDPGSYVLGIEYNDDDAFIISEEDGRFEIRVPNSATEESLYVFADMLWAMGDYLWKTRFKSIITPSIITPNTFGIMS